jgi:hypothetical protein
MSRPTRIGLATLLAGMIVLLTIYGLRWVIYT